MFSKEGPNLIKPEVTKRPKVIPKTYKHSNKIINGKPILKIETQRGIASNTAGMVPINVLKIAVSVNAAIISLILIGEIKRLVKFLLHISLRTSYYNLYLI